MSFFDKLRGKSDVRRAEQVIADAEASARETYGPLLLLGRRIVEVSHQAYQSLESCFGFSQSGQPSQPQMLLFYEFLYFFSHLTLRTLAEQEFSKARFAKVQKYLGPFLASIAVDTFCGHWPEDVKAKLRSNFFEKLNDAEIEYSECRGLFSQADPLDTHTLVGRVSHNAAALFEREDDPLAKMTVATEIVRAFGSMRVNELVENVAGVIDSTDDEMLSSFGERGQTPAAGS